MKRLWFNLYLQLEWVSTLHIQHTIVTLQIEKQFKRMQQCIYHSKRKLTIVVFNLYMKSLQEMLEYYFCCAKIIRAYNIAVEYVIYSEFSRTCCIVHCCQHLGPGPVVFDGCCSRRSVKEMVEIRNWKKLWAFCFFIHFE